MEAYVKDGCLFYRALKNISKRTELLVWYGKELADLLGLRSAQKSKKGSYDYLLHGTSYTCHSHISVSLYIKMY